MRFLSDKNLRGWLESLMGMGSLIAPMDFGPGLTLFSQIRDPGDVNLGYETTPIPPKDLLFPSSEALFKFSRERGYEVPRMEGEAFLLGIRPCDALGIRLMDFPFLSEPADPRYEGRRRRTTLIGLGCIKARPECFCTSFGTGPFDASNVDAFLIPVKGGFLAEARTEKGTKALAAAELEEASIPIPKPPEVPSIDVKAVGEVALSLFNSPYWGRLADRCLSCKLCAYVCPSCYCFDIRDYPIRDGAERIRSWDSCQSPLFSRQASGYDPRQTKASRLRNRFYHKFSYFPGEFGAFGCTGCGRCVRYCPVNIDIREALLAVLRGEVKVA
ncbi:MAG: 4Fe-4S dicluster domain-containing protein [Candidatus Bathyarchaeia archaeon]